MIDTRKIRPTTPPEDNSTPPCEDFIEMIARKQKENQEITTPTPRTPWKNHIGNRLSELGKAIATRGEIKDEWHRELYNICDFITYMEMGENI